MRNPSETSTWQQLWWLLQLLPGLLVKSGCTWRTCSWEKLQDTFHLESRNSPFEGIGEESSQDNCGALVREMTKTHPWCCQRGYPRCKSTVWAGDGARHSHRMSQESSKLPTAGTVKFLKPFREWKNKVIHRVTEFSASKTWIVFKTAAGHNDCLLPIHPRSSGMGWWKMFSDASLSWDCLQILPCFLCRLPLLCSLFLACLFI